ncbi:MAG: PepSY-like domain-containing protein [Bacteroidales bacterium]|nr:PepSY-like domain-containing protein [Bacteroidales bacterium]
MKKLALLVLMGLGFVSCESQEKVAVEFNQLPAKAQNFVKTHFSDKTITVIFYDKDLLDKDYEVIFEDTSNVDFNSKGEWTKIEVKVEPGVPTNAIPTSIVNYVNAKHPNTFIISINKDRRDYEVELRNGLDLVFDKNGNFLRYDD